MLQRGHIPQRFFRGVSRDRKVKGCAHCIDIGRHGDRAIVLLPVRLRLCTRALQHGHRFLLRRSPRIHHHGRTALLCTFQRHGGSPHRDGGTACRGPVLRHGHRRHPRCVLRPALGGRLILFRCGIAVRHTHGRFVSAEDQRCIKIDETDISAVGDHHIARLDIAVDNSRFFAVFLMQILHHFTQLTCPAVALFLGDRAILFHILLQVLATDKIHHGINAAIVAI